MIKRIRALTQSFLSLHTRHPYAVLAVPFVAGILFWGAFNTAMEMTNNEAFCVSCHEMRNNVFKEYKKTVHYNNPTGVRATCPDCHVPKEWIHMVARKISATNELYHKLVGSIDTPEKFKAKRLELARLVWKKMERTDSRECRNCHSFESMDLKRQNFRARKIHKRSLNKKGTCIDCHKGIAHTLPSNFDEDGKEHDRYRKEGVTCSNCHKDMARPAEDDDW